jgi:hypothetical protein
MVTPPAQGQRITAAADVAPAAGDSSITRNEDAIRRALR